MAAPSDKAPLDLLKQLQAGGLRKVKVAVTDIDGVLRGKYLHLDKFLGATESGFGFCNVVFGWDSADVCYDNGKVSGWHTGFPDATASVDLSTMRRIPWEGGLPFFLGDFENPACPRALLKRVVRDAAQAGFEARCGMEFEWFNFKETPASVNEKGFRQLEPLSPGMFGYSILRSTLNQPFFAALMDEMLAFEVPVEGLHTETGPGVLEAAILYSDALTAADRAVLFKTGAKEIGYRFGILPTFMAKFNAALPGCSGHTHLSLWSGGAKAENRFYDERDPHRMSELFKSFVAGQLHCLPEILPFFAPTVNSYKRLVDGYWAPTKATWGVDNRTVACRVIPGSSKSTRLELRVPGSDVNPYLAVAAAVAAGLYGVKKGLKLTDAPVVGSAYAESSKPRLPRNLRDATVALERSEVARELFGEAFVDHYVRTRTWEWRQFEDAVTSWELQRYLEII